MVGQSDSHRWRAPLIVSPGQHGTPLRGSARCAPSSRARRAPAQTTSRSWTKTSVSALAFSGASLSQRSLVSYSLESVRKASRASRSSRHQAAHRQIDEGLTALRQPLVVLAHTPVLPQPRESPLDHPPPRQDREGRARRRLSLRSREYAFTRPRCLRVNYPATRRDSGETRRNSTSRTARLRLPMLRPAHGLCKDRGHDGRGPHRRKGTRARFGEMAGSTPQGRRALRSTGR